MGRLTQVASDRVDATHPAVLASNFVYHSNGAAASVDWGNGTVTERTLNQNHQLKTLLHGPASNPGQFLNLEYDYDEGVTNTGRIMSIVDRNDPSKTVNYTYDDFNRLKTAATVGSHWGLSWTYDRYGNRLSQTKTKGTAPTDGLSVDAYTNRVAGWTYDAAGNTLDDGEHTYAYDANNMIKAIDGGAVQYKYDAAAGRVTKVTPADTVHYALGSEYSLVSGWKRVFASAGGIKVEYRANQTYFHESDHLGTPRVQTDSAGALVEAWSHFPFGEQWEQIGSGANEHRFTGHRRDPETGNDYAGARYLKGSRARWLSTDPVFGDSANPQRLNRYQYARNDAANLIDPDGRKECGAMFCVEVTERLPKEPEETKKETTTKTKFYPPIVGGGGEFVPTERTETGGASGGQLNLKRFRPCSNPRFSFDALSDTTKNILGDDAAAVFKDMASSNQVGLAAFLNIVAALGNIEGFNLAGLRLVSAYPDRNAIVLEGWSYTQRQLSEQFGFNAFGDSLKQDVTFASVNVKYGQFPDHPGRVHVDLDFGGMGTDLLGSVIHFGELIARGETDPFAMYTTLSYEDIHPEYECDLP